MSMRRKLVDYDTFKRIEKDSLTSVTKELSEAAPLIAKTLNVENVTLRTFGPSTAVFETADGNYIHTAYQIKGENILLDNIEQLVVDEETEKKETRETLNKMVEALLGDNDQQAEQLFNEYMSFPLTKRVFSEGKKADEKDKKFKKKDDMPKGKKNPFDPKKKMKKKAFCMEWTNLVKNVIDYVDYQKYGPSLKESAVRTDEKGNVVAVKIPTAKLRNEHKLLSFNWKTLNTDVVVKRSSAKKLSEDISFCKAVAELKRHNNMSDSSALEEALENIVTNWPHVLYLTQNELSENIKAALETVRATNFDDQTCDFMAEGILRVAHDAYVDRVDKIMKLAGAPVAESEDKYAEFKKTVDRFYPTLDETTLLEMQVYVDLYEAIRNVHETAKEENNVFLKAEAVTHLNGLASIIRKENKPTLETAQAAAEWLWQIVETNLETGDWNVSNTPHISINGEHPDMAKKARVGYTPASDFSGDWGDTAPVSDGKSYKGGLADEMRDRAWGNTGGNDVYPSLQNPIYKDEGERVIKGEKTIDSDSDPLAHSGGGETWPSLTNPYLLNSMIPKMKSDDLVVDK